MTTPTQELIIPPPPQRLMGIGHWGRKDYHGIRTVNDLVRNFKEIQNKLCEGLLSMSGEWDLLFMDYSAQAIQQPLEYNILWASGPYPLTSCPSYA